MDKFKEMLEMAAILFVGLCSITAAVFWIICKIVAPVAIVAIGIKYIFY